MNRHCTALRALLSKLGTPTDGVVFNKKMPIENNAIYKMSMQIHEILGFDRFQQYKCKFSFGLLTFKQFLFPVGSISLALPREQVSQFPSFMTPILQASNILNVFKIYIRARITKR